MSRLQEQHEATINELNKMHTTTEKRLHEKLASLTPSETLKAQLLELESDVSKSKDMLMEIESKLKPIYEKQESMHSPWKKQKVEEERNYINYVTLYADFAVYLINKLNNDNKWLVDRLAEFGKENERLKTMIDQSPHHKYRHLVTQVSTLIDC
jgi:hypothetical protein